MCMLVLDTQEKKDLAKKVLVESREEILSLIEDNFVLNFNGIDFFST